MATNFFGGAFFGGGFFGGDSPTPTPDATGGKGDNGRDERRIFKPTGLIDRPKLKARKDVEDRVAEAREIQAEVHEQVAREFGEETQRLAFRQEAPPVETMSLREIDAEIGMLLRKKLRTQEDEIVLLLLMAAAAA